MENTSFPILKNDLILRLIKGEKVERTPIWIMRQAGRYLPEFQAVRQLHSFFDMVQTPELASKITLQPIERYAFDAAIIFSDILIVCQVMGIKVEMVAGKGPVILNPLTLPSDFKRLNFEVDISQSLKYLFDAITLTRHKLEGKCPLIGFAGAPWTLMAYMIDSSNTGGAKNFSQARSWLYQYPTESKILLDGISKLIANLLIEQANAGAQLLMIFESHGDVLNKSLFQEFSYPFLEKIYEKIRNTHKDVPIIVFGKGCHYAIEILLKSSFEVIGIDWTIEPEVLRRYPKLLSSKTIMGNLDPATLYGNKETIEIKTKEMLEKFNGIRHICNLGHGIYPDISLESVETFVNSVRKTT